MIYKTKYVPVDAPRVVCGNARVEDSFKDRVELSSALLPDVKTDDDVELLAKAALDDLLALDFANEQLVNEVNKLEQRCADEEETANADRVTVLEAIDELNKP